MSLPIAACAQARTLRLYNIAMSTLLKFRW